MEKNAPRDGAALGHHVAGGADARRQRVPASEIMQPSG
jgi:hypothetical protein